MQRRDEEKNGIHEMERHYVIYYVYPLLPQSSSELLQTILNVCSLAIIVASSTRHENNDDTYYVYLKVNRSFS